ncbi:hypothetical protein K461DRAFT_275405 [Myriangium duriaei CBS 260.36]|uniref:Uncharacterized protein n=1 Tax=Myriangium duriaei CBS 260.36 TaxID=1168546 RepID=A0A9P4J738_9PEZI|nr:hypothetical protein K461DRAFT_275405 [Myriangium duriaei CBS 260.36]
MGKLQSTTTLLTPLLLALALYLFLTFLLLPFLRHYRARYESYVPLQLRTANLSSTSLRDQLAGFVTAFVLRTRFSREARNAAAAAAEDEEDGVGLDEAEEGELAYLPRVELARA